jgi:hypothetical protein
MKFSFSYNYLNFDQTGYYVAFKEHLEAQMKEAAGEFAKAALARIPIRTGFVAGAFADLESLLGNSARLNPIAAFIARTIKTARTLVQGKSTRLGNRRTFVEGEFYYPPGGGRILKSPQTGRQFATPLSDIIIVEENLLRFHFQVDITYFNINDVNPGHSPTAPWGAFEAGKLAFLEHMKTKAFKNVPRIADFIKKTRKNA